MIREVLALANVVSPTEWQSLRDVEPAGIPSAIAAHQVGLSRLQTVKLDQLRAAAGAKAGAEIDDAISAAYESFERRVPVDVVWSGSDLSAASQVRDTFAAATSVISSATRELIVAGFQVDARILDDLGCRAALVRGVGITVLSNDVESGDVYVQALRAAGARVIRARPQTSGIDKFHVKAVIADANIALIGSANLTYLGQHKNVELGLLVRGHPAGVAAALLREFASRAERGF